MVMHNIRAKVPAGYLTACCSEIFAALLGGALSLNASFGSTPFQFVCGFKNYQPLPNTL